MPNSTKKSLLEKTIATGIQGLKQFSYLWSTDTLASLPERLKNLWQQLIGSYWFIPTACVLLGILLAPLLIAIDEHFDRKAVKEIGFAFTGSDAAARAIMTAIAGAVLGVAGTTFSITIAVLSMASSQFGPRLLRNFLTDTSNQLVLGAFIGTFSYSLLVLKAIHKQDVAFGVPQLAVTFAIIMAISCALLLVYFIQHMVHAIQASHVIQHASDDAMENIDYWYGKYCDVQHQRDVEQVDIEQYKQWPATPIYAPHSGYLQQIYVESVVALAKDYGGIIRLHTNLGDFVTDRNIIGYFYQRPDDQVSHLQKTKTSNLALLARRPDGNFWQRLSACVDLVRRPTHSNDIAYSLGQVTEIAIRALSPGTNDPKTAISCVQSLTICLSVMMRRQPPSPYHFYTPDHDHDDLTITTNRPRLPILAVITKTPKISDFIDASLGDIRRYATADLMVLKTLCQAMTDLNYSCVNDGQRQTLLRELTLIERAGEENLAYSELVDDLFAMCRQARQFIEGDSAQHQHFEYTGSFSAHIHKTLESQSS
ncbi:DUF2254 domain-containing protein [uncultured Psychrobacter sp.]|uniref:DUF2254 domain-containing protein n=1 Tax=uncultured Psychrobacter sp. TaxID=259303 RepID=UPI003458D34F